MAVGGAMCGVLMAGVVAPLLVTAHGAVALWGLVVAGGGALAAMIVTARWVSERHRERSARGEG